MRTDHLLHGLLLASPCRLAVTDCAVRQKLEAEKVKEPGLAALRFSSERLGGNGEVTARYFNVCSYRGGDTKQR